MDLHHASLMQATAKINVKNYSYVDCVVSITYLNWGIVLSHEQCALTLKMT